MQIILLLHKIEGGNKSQFQLAECWPGHTEGSCTRLNKSQNQRTWKKEETPVFLQLTWARSYMVSLSSFLKENGGICPWWSSPIHFEYGAFVFPTAMISVWFHHVGIRSHHFQTMLT